MGRHRPGRSGGHDTDDRQQAVVGQAEVGVAPHGREEGGAGGHQGGVEGQGQRRRHQGGPHDAGTGGRALGRVPVEAGHGQGAGGPRRLGR